MQGENWEQGCLQSFPVSSVRHGRLGLPKEGSCGDSIRRERKPKAIADRCCLRDLSRRVTCAFSNDLAFIARGRDGGQYFRRLPPHCERKGSFLRERLPP